MRNRAYAYIYTVKCGHKNFALLKFLSKLPLAKLSYLK
jgi:hypothetical protein